MMPNRRSRSKVPAALISREARHPRRFENKNMHSHLSGAAVLKDE